VQRTVGLRMIPDSLSALLIRKDGYVASSAYGAFVLDRKQRLHECTSALVRSSGGCRNGHPRGLMNTH
jgi:hypothetical protein